jgi:hypothetical protein
MINGAIHLEKRCEWKNDVKKLSIQLFLPFYG